MEIDSSYVSLIMDQAAEYLDKKSLFRPHIDYPEYPFHGEISKIENEIYAMVRENFAVLKMDQENYGSKSWNPLGNIVAPGNTVLIKPNLVMDTNSAGSVRCMFTQPDVVAAVIDYVIIALGKQGGKIIVGDAPVQECNFENLMKISGYLDLIGWYSKHGIDIEIKDFRGIISIKRNGLVYPEIVAGREGIMVDLASKSEFGSLPDVEQKRLRITNYSPSQLAKHHSNGKHEYCIAQEVLQADVIINMPKPKTHRLAGVTLALKNTVGMNVLKECLPHHSLGSTLTCGDEYKRRSLLKCTATRLCDIRNEYMASRKYTTAQLLHYLQALLKRGGMYLNGDATESGNWYGNKTICKTIADLNKIIFYADKQGKMQEKVQRKYLIVADMIIAGEGNGPLSPTDKPVGIIAMGFMPLLFDETIATLMGADTSRIPTFRTIRGLRSYQICRGEVVTVVSNKVQFNHKSLPELYQNNFHFKPAKNWANIFEGTHS